MDELKAVYERVHKIAPKLYEDEASFRQSVEYTYGQKNRFFHGINHLLEMVGQDDAFTKQAYKDLEASFNQAYADKPLSRDEVQWLKDVNFIAALGHDFEYHVDGHVSKSGEKTLSAYVEPTNVLPTRIKDQLIDENHDPIAWATLEIFGLKPGENLSIFNGQNEFLSALFLAKKLEEAGVEKAVIVGVIESVAATVPFKTHDKFQELKSRTAKVAKVLNLGEDQQRLVDMLSANATLLANKDVISFGGELFQRNADLKSLIAENGDKAVEKLTQDISAKDLKLSFASGDHLTTEEGSPELQRATVPGIGFSPNAILEPSFKRVRLGNMLIGQEKVFHGMEIGSGETSAYYPPAPVVSLMNKAVTNADKTGSMDILAPAYKARVASLSLVNTVGAIAGIQKADLQIFVLGMQNDPFMMQDVPMPESKDLHRVVDVLSDRISGNKNDATNSPIAVRLIKGGVHQEKLTKIFDLAEENYGKGNKQDPKAFLEGMKNIAGDELIDGLVDAVARTTMKNMGDNLKQSGIQPESFASRAAASRR